MEDGEVENMWGDKFLNINVVRVSSWGHAG